jgi:hypothetical protein
MAWVLMAAALVLKALGQLGLALLELEQALSASGQLAKVHQLVLRLVV